METPPAELLQGKDTPGNISTFAGNDTFKINLPSATVSVSNNFGELPPSSLSGTVYRDLNANGMLDAKEPGLSSVTITLSGTNDLGPVKLTTTTNSTGSYAFMNLRPGSYTITETTPAGFGSVGPTVGTQGGTASGNVITVSNLKTNTLGTGNNFGAITQPPTFNAGPDVSTMCQPGGTVFSHTVTFTDTALNGPWTATVNYGDGSTLQTINLGTLQSFVLQHSYAQPGVYQVSITITDAFGASSSGNFLFAADANPITGYSKLVTINDGSAQRSMIDSITVSFGQLATVGAGAFSLVNTVTGAIVPLRVILRNIGGQTVALLDFTGAGIINGSLADGTYALTIVAANITLQSGGAWNGGVNYTSAPFKRMFGDVNGDGLVNATDLAAFNAAMRSKMGDANYCWYLDYDGNCQIDATDYRYFLMDYRP